MIQTLNGNELVYGVNAVKEKKKLFMKIAS